MLTKYRYQMNLSQVWEEIASSTGASEPVDEGTVAEGIFATALQGTGKRLAKLKDDEGGGAVSFLLFDTGEDMASTWWEVASYRELVHAQRSTKNKRWSKATEAS